jgi:hypothetical protein
MRDHPYSLTARGTPAFHFRPRKMRGSEAPRNAEVCETSSAAWRSRRTHLMRHIASVANGGAPLGAPLAAFFVPVGRTSGRVTEKAFGLPANGQLPPPVVSRTSSHLRRPVLVPADGLAGASRARGYEPRPRAPHPAPPSARLRKTPLDEQDENRNIYNRNKVKCASIKIFGAGAEFSVVPTNDYKLGSEGDKSGSLRFET